MSGGSAAPPRRDEALAFIIERIVRFGGSPTYDEIAQGMQPPVKETRAKQLVAQLISRGIVGRTPGAARGLYIRDVAGARLILDHTLLRLGFPTAVPLGALQQPCLDRQLPRLPEITYLPEA